MEYDLQRATKQFEKLIKKLNESHEQAKVGSSSVVTASIALKDSTVSIMRNLFFSLF